MGCGAVVASGVVAMIDGIIINVTMYAGVVRSCQALLLLCVFAHAGLRYCKRQR